ncbi:uncharacterized protein DUF3144 [Pseudoduganella flava]|uniref:DUF3144 domain-containing protein n=1 Tax=Pseudoduganella flava TaxID=871742 RepID=A0A562PT95_9BURK|nr:DUF3144 domain-containing protein [Pseudoduganella flava]QGZ39380.1 DUF3144 domain-containing protein [Pseudoduganella flava]TWI47306.1 uncharacterized protein DUF3144 [Pseudoduganella flava]
MNNQDYDQEFWQLIDQFIQFANEKGQASGAPPHVAGAALMFAASRFNAFLLARNAGTVEKFAANRDEALAYFRQQFDKMMAENVNDYEQNFDKYIGQ